MVVWSLIALIYIDAAILAWAVFTGRKLVDVRRGGVNRKLRRYL